MTGRPARSNARPDSASPEQIQRELAETRAELTATLDTLVERLDIRTNLRRRVRLAGNWFTHSRMGIAVAVLTAAAVAAILAARNHGRNR